MSSSVFVLAAPTTIDQWAQYDGSGWGYNSSSGNFTWNTNMANSSEFVVLSYLRDLYSSVKSYNDNLKSGWLFTSSGYSYPSGWSGSFYKVVLDVVNNVNTSINNNLHSNLQSYSSYPLYSYKQFIDSGLNNSQSFSSNNFIINFLSGISALNTNISYIANQFYADNTSGSYNARSLLNQALHKYLDSTQTDYTTILNNIKTDTANLSGIKTDTANLPGIKTDTANLSGIYTDTSNISSDTSNILSKLSNYTGVATKYNTKGVWNTALVSYDIPAKYSPYITIAANNNPRVLFSNMNNAQPLDFLEIINKNIVQTANLIHTNYTAYPIIQDDNQGGTTLSSYYNYSLMDALYNINYMMGSELSAIKYMVADPATIAAKKANASQEQAVLSNYTGNGSASASVADFGNIKDGVGSVKTGLNTNVSVSNIFNIFNNNDGYSFWSDDTRAELNSTGSNRSNYKARGVSDTPLYDAKINELYNAMGVNHD